MAKTKTKQPATADKPLNLQAKLLTAKLPHKVFVIIDGCIRLLYEPKLVGDKTDLRTCNCKDVACEGQEPVSDGGDLVTHVNFVSFKLSNAFGTLQEAVDELKLRKLIDDRRDFTRSYSSYSTNVRRRLGILNDHRPLALEVVQELIDGTVDDTTLTRDHLRDVANSHWGEFVELLVKQKFPDLTDNDDYDE